MDNESMEDVSNSGELIDGILESMKVKTRLWWLEFSDLTHPILGACIVPGISKTIAVANAQLLGCIPETYTHVYALPIPTHIDFPSCEIAVLLGCGEAQYVDALATEQGFQLIYT